MKKIVIIIPLLLTLIYALPFLFFEYFGFTVLPGMEAVVTQSGTIVGEPKKSGFHRINPFTQKAHHVDMERLRVWLQDFKKGKDYSIRVYWKVNNSPEYYNQSQHVNIEEELGEIFQSIKVYIENEVDENVVEHISFMKSKDWDFVDSNLKDLVVITQGKTKKFGVEIVRIDFMLSATN